MSDDNTPPNDGGDNGAPAPQEPGNNWRDSLPENVKDWDEARNASDQAAFWQQMEAHRKHLGQSIRIPTEDAGVDTVNQFHEKLLNKVPGLMRVPDVDNPEIMAETFAKLGAPAEADGYQMPDRDLGLDDGKFQMLQSIAHAAKFTKTQWNQFITQIAESDASSAKAAEEAINANREALQSDWGAATDERLATVAKIAELTGAPESMQQVIKDNKLDPASANWLYNLSKQLDGEGLQVAHQQANPTYAPQEASDSINDIYSNPDHPYHNPGHPGHRDAKLKMHKLRLQRAGRDPESVPFVG